MRKDDPSSSRPTRRRKLAAPASLELGLRGGRPAARKQRTQRPPLDLDFGLALCLLPGLRGKRLPDA